MADIIDSFVVELGLDPTKYKDGIKKFRDDLKNTRDETRRQTREMESDARRAQESFSNLKSELIGLFLVAAGANSLGNLIGDMIHGAAVTGRFANNIGTATEEVSAFEGAVRSMGGSAEDARAALAALNSEYTSYSLTGRATHDADLAAMGISAHDLSSPMGLASALAERSQHMSRREFAARMQRIGMPESVINTLARGRQGLHDLIEEQYRLGVVTERDSRIAQQFERDWANLTTQLRGELRPELSWLVGNALPWLEAHGPLVANIMGVGLAGSFGLMTVALVRMAGPLGVVLAGLTGLYELFGTEQGQSWINSFLERFGYHLGPGTPEGWTPAHVPPTDIYGRFQLLRLQSELMNLPNTPENAARRTEVQREIAQINNGGWAPDASGGSSGGTNAGLNPWHSAVAARVRATEGGHAGYDAVVYGIHSPRPPTSMTLGDVFNYQRGALRAQTRGRRGAGDIGSTGMGAYQFESLTLRTAAQRVFGAGWQNHQFTPETQNRLFEAIYATEGLSPWAIGHHRMPGAGARMAAQRGGGGNVSVGSIVVYTPPGTARSQADAVAREIPHAIRRRGVVTQANNGLQ